MTGAVECRYYGRDFTAEEMALLRALIAEEVRPLDLRTVVRATREGKRWNEFIARYHYLGYKTLVGAQMRYAVHDRNGCPLAMLGFSTAAWKLAPRDKFIGWTPQLREKNLPLVVDNPRFLILPWINIHNLGSHILAIVRRRLPQDWTERYHTTPVLIETFVETPRYTGAVYKASGWTHVGATQGRGRYDRHTKRSQPKKGHLAATTPKRLEANAQSLNPPYPSPHNGTITLCWSRQRRRQFARYEPIQKPIGELVWKPGRSLALQRFRSWPPVWHLAPPAAPSPRRNRSRVST